MKKGKKALYWTIGAAVLQIAVFVCYYVTLPAINIHSEGFWFFLMGLIIAGALLHMLRQTVKIQKAYGKNAQVNWKDFKLVKALGILFLVILAVYLIGSILSSPIVNAKKYQALLTVEERNFTDDLGSGLQHDPAAGPGFGGDSGRPQDGQHGGNGFPV